MASCVDGGSVLRAVPIPGI